MSPHVLPGNQYASYPSFREDAESPSPSPSLAEEDRTPIMSSTGSAAHTPAPVNNSAPQQLQQQSAPRPAPSPSSGLNGVVTPLHNVPVDIAIHRQHFFDLNMPVQMTPIVWERFWPYIDNVWCIHQKPRPTPSTGIQKIYGACRLHRKSNLPPPVVQEGARPRNRREGGTCQAKFRMTVYPDGRRVLERTGEEHSHTLEHIDSIKRNSGLRNLALDSFFKAWEAGGIIAFLRDTSATLPHDPLKAAGGLFLGRQEVQNVLNGALRRAYPGQDVAEVKKQMDKYKNYTTCNFRGCNAPAFSDIKVLMEHRKNVHGFKSHDHSDKQYACPEKGCWRKKKSKGFATLIGLEEHMKEKHGTGALEHRQSAGQDETVQSDSRGQDASTENESSDLSLNFGNTPLVGGTDASNPMTNDPMTPESSGEGQHGDPRSHTTYVQPMQAQSRQITWLWRENTKMQIKRLEADREKIDAEIRWLNKALWGDERGENAAFITSGGSRSIAE